MLPSLALRACVGAEDNPGSIALAQRCPSRPMPSRPVPSGRRDLLGGLAELPLSHWASSDTSRGPLFWRGFAISCRPALSARRHINVPMVSRIADPLSAARLPSPGGPDVPVQSLCHLRRSLRSQRAGKELLPHEQVEDWRRGQRLSPRPGRLVRHSAAQRQLHLGLGAYLEKAATGWPRSSATRWPPGWGANSATSAT